jgi:hypothetical protein
MDQKNDRTPRDPAQAEPPRAAETPPAPRKRFRIEKIEERIAPGGHYNPHSKWVGGSDPGGSAQSSVSGSIGSSVSSY